MVKVERTSEPQILVQNASTWTQELEEQIRLQGEFKKVPDRFIKRYNHEEIKAALEKMYGEKCCYCEGHISECSYGHIEHRMPKSRFPSQTFAWENLHWSCEVCNNTKGEKWSDAAPILDATVDDVEEHFDFDFENCTILPKNNSVRAQTTIEHADLNRPGLIKARKRLKNRIIGILLHAQSTASPEVQAYCRRELESLTINDPDNGAIAEHSLFVKRLLIFLLS
jgi:uncharacterized protein (TIGR02646 family)